MFLDLYVGWWTDEYIQYCCSIGFPFWQGLRQDVQAKQQALHRLQQAQEVRRMHSAAQKDIVQHKEEEQVLRVAVQRGKEEQEAAVARHAQVVQRQRDKLDQTLGLLQQERHRSQQFKTKLHGSVHQEQASLEKVSELEEQLRRQEEDRLQCVEEQTLLVHR